MKYKQLIAIPILGFALCNLANAGQVPSINSIGGFVVPTAHDFSFDNRGLSVSVASDAGGYLLTASGTGSFTFYGPTPGTAYSGTTSGTGYSLAAQYDANSNFVSGGLTINGTLATTPVGSGAANGLLYSANLTAFGYDANQAAIAFKTVFNPSWSNQSIFTGGSLGEIVYLFDQSGLTSGHGHLSALDAAFATGNLASVVGNTYSGVESIATVPLPLPAMLFGTALTAFMGLGRKRGSNAISI